MAAIADSVWFEARGRRPVSDDLIIRLAELLDRHHGVALTPWATGGAQGTDGLSRLSG